jgi:hypothetical protein
VVPSYKYQFVTVTGTNTQGVESFNNILKMEIKNMKGVLTEKRGDFLKELSWMLTIEMIYCVLCLN